MRIKRIAGLGIGIIGLAIVRRPIARKLRYHLRRQEMLESYARAANDPEFLADDDEITRAFDSTVGDGLGRA